MSFAVSVEIESHVQPGQAAFLESASHAVEPLPIEDVVCDLFFSDRSTFHHLTVILLHPCLALSGIINLIEQSCLVDHRHDASCRIAWVESQHIGFFVEFGIIAEFYELVPNRWLCRQELNVYIFFFPLHVRHEENSQNY